ncbi:MAG: S-methyl-5-thioribose kinase [Gammaproteobacteria bacterium]
MKYQVLNHTTLINYLRQLPQWKALGESATLTIKEVSDGNLNQVFVAGCNEVLPIVIQTDHVAQTAQTIHIDSVIIKQALPYIRCLGTDYPLSERRMDYEIYALQDLSACAPRYFPEIYHADYNLSVVILQHLTEHTLLRDGLISGVYYPQLAEQLANMLAHTLFYTSSFALEYDAKQLLQQRYLHSPMCALSQAFIFNHAFMNHETNHFMPEIAEAVKAIQRDAMIKRAVLQLKYQFSTQAQALLHGDLHTGSLMVNLQEIRVIDLEFACVGPMGFDLGLLLAHLIIAWAAHFERFTKNEAESYRHYLLTMIMTLLQQFNTRFLDLWQQRISQTKIPLDMTFAQYQGFQLQFLQYVLQDAIGFAGCEMMRRVIGAAGVKDTESISDRTARARVECLLLNIARDFLYHYHVMPSISDVIKILNQHAQQYFQQHRLMFVPTVAAT